MAQGHSNLTKISLIGKSLDDLRKTGIAFDHGYYEESNSFTGDFSPSEIEKLTQLGFKLEAVDLNSKLLRSRTLECEPDTTQAPFYRVPANYSIGSMNGFLNLADLYENLDLMYELYPNLITKRTRIGNFATEEGQSLFYLKISDNPNNSEAEPQILYTALHHAREPASMSQMLFFMWYLLENYDKDPAIKKLVDSRELYFVPCVNPDGYRYNEQTNPSGYGYWRKNRTINEEGFGIDLNRNYGYEWGFNNIGSSDSGDSEIFRGTSAFSESETQAIKELCRQHKFKIAINYHTFGNILIVPWGYINTVTKDQEQFFSLAKEFTKYNKFTIGTATNTLNYQVNGVSDDWMYGDTISKNKIFAFTPEIGEDFWPDRSKIGGINQSTQYINISSAWNAGSVASMSEVSSETIEPVTGKLQLLVKRTGLEDADIKIKCTSNLPGQIEITDPQVFRLLPTEERIIEINYIINSKLSNTSIISFSIDLETGGYTENIKVNKRYLGTAYWKDEANNLDYWESSFNKFLSVSTEDFASSPSCFTESPNSMHLEDKTYFMNTEYPIDLTGSTYAYLTYKLKYDLDKEKDFAQILVSDDGINYNPVCAKYTSPGGILQALDQPIYTGLQKNWIADWVDLKDFIGKKIHLQIKVGTTQSLETHDGFLLDDIKIYSDLISNFENIKSDEISVYPQPVHDELIIKDVKNKICKVQLINAQGLTQKLNFVHKNNSWTSNVSGLPAGVYFIKCIDNSNHSQTSKVIIQ